MLFFIKKKKKLPLLFSKVQLCQIKLEKDDQTTSLTESCSFIRFVLPTVIRKGGYKFHQHSAELRET